VCQHSSFLVFASLSNPTPARWSKVTAITTTPSTTSLIPLPQVTHISVGFAAAVCVTIGVAGYLPFVNGVCPDVLNSFPRSDPATSGERAAAACAAASAAACAAPPALTRAAGARFLLAITMFFTYPMEFFVTRFAIISAIRRRWSHVQHKDNTPHYTVTALLWLVTTLLGTFSTDLGIILDVTGSVAAVFLAFILPGWLSVKLDNLRFFSRQALKQAVLIVVGSFFMIISSILILLTQLKVMTGEHACATRRRCITCLSPSNPPPPPFRPRAGALRVQINRGYMHLLPLRRPAHAAGAACAALQRAAVWQAAAGGCGA